MRKTVIAALLLTALTVQHICAETIRCRSGLILNAEISTTRISSASFRQVLAGYPKSAFAVITIKLDQNRKISMFDYELIQDEKAYPCLSVNSGKGFKYSPDAVGGEGQTVQLLFVCKPFNAKTKTATLVLKSKFSPEDIYTCEVPFAVIGKKGFTAIAKIPAEGMLKTGDAE